MNNIDQLVKALQSCGIDATVHTFVAVGMDNKSRRCTFVHTDYWTGEDNLEFIFNPDTGKLVDSILECPAVND